MWSSSSRRRFSRLAVAGLVAAGATGCGEQDRAVVLEVFAAASLTEVLTGLAAGFEAGHPGVSVRFSIAASSTVARQVEQGAPADVVATADQASMARLVQAGLVGEPEVVARNRLAVLVRPGNPERVGGLADLARPGLAVALCAPEVPCGRLAAAALERAGVDVRPASVEANVKAVVARVTFGEADAGLVYASDAVAAGAQAGALPLGGDLADDRDLQAVYPMAVARDADAPGEARAFVDLVRSPAGQRALAATGFLEP